MRRGRTPLSLQSDMGEECGLTWGTLDSAAWIPSGRSGGRRTRKARPTRLLPAVGSQRPRHWPAPAGVMAIGGRRAWG